MGKLEGRTALVTGSTQGIGRAVAERLAAEGATVVVHGPDRVGVDRTLDEIPGSFGVVGDISDSDAVAALCAEARDAVGPLQIVVNNAGTSVSGPFLEQTDRDWDLLLSVNLLGTRDVLRAVIPDMVEAGWGRIVNMTSEAGIHGTPTFAGYAASKGAIASLTLTLAQEFASTGIVVNGFAPLGITDLLRANVPDEILDGLRDAGMPTLERNAEELLPLVVDDAPNGQIRAMHFDGTPTSVHGGLADG